MSSKQRYLCIDTETTGLRFNDGDRIYDISCVEVIDGKVNRTFQAYCNPMKVISEETKRIAFVPNDLEKQPSFKDIFNDFVNLLQYNSDNEPDDPVLVIHNAKFDLGFISNECKIADIDFDISAYRCIDTVKMARLKFPDKKVNLDALSSMFEIDTGDKRELHKSLDDSIILANVFIKMSEDDDPDNYIQKDNYEIHFGIKKRSEILQPRTIYSVSENEEKLHLSFMSKINKG